MMHRTITPCVALAGLVFALHAAGPQPRLPRDNLLVYRGADGKPVPVKTAADWAKRRAEVVRGMEAVMGKLPGTKKRCPLAVKTESEVDCGSYVRRLITYASEPGSRVPAYLLIPRDVLAGKKKVPAILCLHGTNNVVGHGVVVGLGGTPNRGYALELAQRGYVTLAPNYPLLAKYQPDLKKLGWESGTLKAVWDNMRGLDLLASLPYVDGTKMGAIGHSLGGHNSVYTAVFDDRLRVIVSSCGLDSYLDYYKGDEKNWRPEKGWCQTRYMRKLADYRGRLADIPFDFHEMIGALAPRHVLIIAPKKDSNFRADSVDRIAAAARPVFKLLGHEDHLVVEHPDCGHDFPKEMREKAYRLFDKILVGKLPVGDATGATADIEDLRLIPADGRWFLSVRLAELWKTPGARKAVADARKHDPRSSEPAARMKKEFGIEPEDVERASLVCSDKGHLWVVVRTVGAYDRRKVLSRLEGAKRRVHQGRSYSVGTDQQGGEAAVWLAGPRVVVTGSEEGVKGCIALASGAAPNGPLEPIIARCKGKHHVVAGIDGKRLDGLKPNRLLSWITPLGVAWATVDVAGQADRELPDTQLTMHAQAADEKQANALHRHIAAIVALAPDFLSSKMDVDVAMGLSFLVREEKVERKGREVIVRCKGNVGDLIEALVLLACRSSSLRRNEGLLLEVRSPFGVFRVEDNYSRYPVDSRQPPDHWYPVRRLVHGYTLHAKQFTEPTFRNIPLSYYHATGPVGQVFRACNTDPKQAVAVIDLGAGTMACYGLPGQTVDFYERDRELVSLSFDTNAFFTFVEDAQARGVDVNLVLGDARSTFAPGGAQQRLQPLRVRKGQPRPKRQYGRPLKGDFKYRLIVVDTLGPDALPGHVVTRINKQAVKTYFDRLEKDGIVLIHISSRYFDLQPVLANIAAELGVVGYHRMDDDDDAVGKNRSHWVALTRKPEYLAGVLSVPRWSRDPAQLLFLGGALWPSGGSPRLQALAGLCHAGQALTDLQAQKVHKEEGRSGDPRQVETGWEPLETTAQLRRIQGEAPREIRALTARIAALKKKLRQPRIDPVTKNWLDARIASLDQMRKKRERQLGSAARKIRRNASLGVWADDSADLLSAFVR